MTDRVMTLAQKHCNPGNVKQNGWTASMETGAVPDPWAGSYGQDERGHTKFSNPDYGVRAMTRTIERKLEGKGESPALNILDLFKGTEASGFDDGWASANDTIGSIPGFDRNTPQAYAEFVANFCKVDVGAPLRLFTWMGGVRVNELPTLILIEKAITAYESGHEYRLRLDVYLQGIALHQQDFVRVGAEG